MSPYWLIAVLVAVFGAAVLGRTRSGRPQAAKETRENEPVRPPVEPLQPGERYDETVRLATVPNVPLADLWCQRLRAEGIEAFYKSTSGFYVGQLFGGSATNPGMPVEIWVGKHALERARQLFPELAQ